MLRRKSPWKIGDAEEEVVCSHQDIDDAEEEVSLENR
jgi:hypothetical protein